MTSAAGEMDMTPAETREEVRSLVSRVEQISDPYRGMELVRARILELVQTGCMVPEELRWIERRLMISCDEAVLSP